jgi:hypothetical protein
VEERPLSSRAKKKVKAHLDKVERERYTTMFQRRMELARNGSILFKKERYKEAVESFYRYLDILERWKKVKPGSLQPNQFDHKKDVAEMLLLTGVYWDLARLHDQFSKKDISRLKSYLAQFVLFSKGMPYEHVCGELVRKYLINGNPKNRKLFKEVHVKLGGGKCFIATAVEDHCAPVTVPTLRQFRDEKLLPNFFGRIFVRVYYRLSPPLALLILKMPDGVQKKIARGFDYLVMRLKMIK